jgi:hypothetical protein
MSSNHRQHNRHRIVLILLLLVFSATVAITTVKAFGVGVTNCNNNSFRRRNTISHTIRINRAAATAATATGRIISTTTTIAATTKLSSCHIQFRRSLSSRLNNSSNNMASSKSNHYQRLESPSAERNKEVIWDVLSSKIFTNPYWGNKNDSNKEKRRINNVLEIAAGSGVHTEYFVTGLLKQQPKLLLPSLVSSLMWYPTDPTTDARESIQSYINDEQNFSHLKYVVADPIELTLDSTGISNNEVISLQPPFNIDNEENNGNNGNKNIDLIVCINMIHISSWDATIGLMKLANKHLREDTSNNDDDNGESKDYDGGYLYCYGPYKVNGNAVQSNL